MAIRSATPDDASSIARLHYEGSLLTTHADVLDPATRARLKADQAEMWDELLARPPVGQVVFVIEPGHVAAFASAGPDPDSNGAAGKLFALFVERESWGLGLGSRLLDAAEHHLSGLAADASLWVLESNVRARRLYEHRGWDLDGPNKEKYGVRFVRYCKHLAPPPHVA